MTIGGTLEAIEDGVYDASPDVIAGLSEEAEHVRRLVQDLRDLASADAGRIALLLTRVDLAEVARSVVQAQSAAARQLQVQLRLDAGAEPVTVEADPDRLRQVLGNLVGNALRHSEAGGLVTVALGLDGDRAVLTVTDTGEGIDPDDLPHVFDRFWRADRARSRATGGSGLGLAIAQELVRAHGGTIDVTSRPGQGSTFTVRLTLADPAVAGGDG